MERWPSGRRRTPGKCVYGNPVSRVRIPPSPPDSSKGARVAPFAFPAPGVSGFEPEKSNMMVRRVPCSGTRASPQATTRRARHVVPSNPSLSARFKQRGPSGPFCISSPWRIGIRTREIEHDGSTGAVQRYLSHLRPRGSCLSVGGWVLVRPSVFTVSSVRRLPCCGWPRFVVGCLRAFVRPPARRCLASAPRGTFLLAQESTQRRAPGFRPGTLLQGPRAGGAELAALRSAQTSSAFSRPEDPSARGSIREMKVKTGGIP